MFGCFVLKFQKTQMFTCKQIHLMMPVRDVHIEFVICSVPIYPPSDPSKAFPSNKDFKACYPLLLPHVNPPSLALMTTVAATTTTAVADRTTTLVTPTTETGLAAPASRVAEAVAVTT